jgi:hypothetical protein
MSERESRIGMTGNWGSVHGIIPPHTLLRDEDGVSALVIGSDGVETRVKGYGAELSALIETSAERGEPVILRGHLLGSEQDGSRHLKVLIEGPAVLKGVISEIKRTEEGQTPHVAFWLMNEAQDGEGTLFPYLTGVNVHGTEAEQLSGLSEGDRVSVEVRDGPHGHIATSAVIVLSEPEPDSEDDPGI